MKHEKDFENQLSEEGVARETSQERAYRIVFSSLERDPLPGLSPLFADQVMSRLVAKQNQVAARDSFYLVAGIVSILGAAITGAWLSGFTLDVGIFKFFSGYTGLVLFGSGFVAVIHWLDQKFVRSKNLI